MLRIAVAILAKMTPEIKELARTTYRWSHFAVRILEWNARRWFDARRALGPAEFEKDTRWQEEPAMGSVGGQAIRALFERGERCLNEGKVHHGASRATRRNLQPSARDDLAAFGKRLSNGACRRPVPQMKDVKGNGWSSKSFRA